LIYMNEERKMAKKKKPKLAKSKRRGSVSAAGRAKAKSVKKKSASRPAAKRARKRVAARKVLRTQVSLTAWDADSVTTAIDAVWDQSDGSAMSNCAANISQPNQDCNCFLKNAARGFFSSVQAFDDANKLADDIIGILADSSNGWTEIADSSGDGVQRTADAIAAFGTSNKIVIAGMTSGELGDTKGHLALVVKGTETAGSANLVVPKCTAGSIKAAGRVKDRGVNWSFGKTMPKNVRYFTRAPDTSPPVALMLRRKKRRPR
jgi:hypothetical protein